MNLPNSADAVKPGDEVILGRHDSWQYWHGEMDQYVGKTTRIVRYYDRDGYGKHRYYVEIDQQAWPWRVENMKRPYPGFNIDYEPAVCVECGQPNEYVAYVKDFVCTPCSSWRKVFAGDLVPLERVNYEPEDKREKDPPTWWITNKEDF